jgi:transglutaminase-like putative cysteine protease
MLISRFIATAAFAVAAFVPTAHAEDKAQYPYIEKAWHGTYDVDGDGRVTLTVMSRYQILQESVLEKMKVNSFSYSTSVQSGEVLEAYTLKKDGSQVPVPPGNYQRQTNDGLKGAGPMFSDFTRVSVVYPDLAVGDTVHIRYRTTEKEPMFPGQFSLALRFSLFRTQEDTRVTIRLPKNMALKKESYFFKAQEEREVDGKRVMEWRYSNLTPRRYVEEEDSGLWSMSESPSVLVSTFGSYEAIAKAYGDRALPKAQPSARIRELVRQTLGTETRPREKARLLYEWVSKNITYGGNCIGVGAVVPRDVDVVLDNKMGDCKDHATLLQAMLNAADIRSEQVLVNAGNQYELLDTPVVSLVNHVMNFLPEFKLYVDATAKEVPFGLLPGDTYAKPVIHVGAAKALATVPSENHLDNEQRLRMTLKLEPNGSASGTMHVAVKGAQAAQARAYMRDLSSDSERDFVKEGLSSYGFKGRGTLEKGDTAGLSDRYAFSVKFTIDNFLRSGTSGAFVFAPVMWSPWPVHALSDVESRTVPKRRDACHGFHSYETFDIELPAGLTFIEMPEDIQVKEKLVDYVAKYKKTATSVMVTRELHDKTPDSICSPEVAAAFLKQAMPVGENLRTQVLYKRKMP